MYNNIPGERPSHPRFGRFSPYLLVTCEVRIRICRKSKRYADTVLRAEIMTSYFLDQMLTHPAKSLDPRIEPSKYRLSPWLYYVVRREFRLMSLAGDLSTIDVVRTLGPNISRQHLRYAYEDRMIVYPDLSDHDL